MALEFLKLADAALAKEFNKKPEKDLMPARRAKVVEGINRALAAIGEKQDNPKGGVYRTREGTSLATIRLGSKRLTVNGAEEFYVPRERLADFYKAALKSVEAGELDAAILEALDIAPKAKKGSTAKANSDRAPIAPWRVYRRNLTRYGAERANELLDAKNSPEEAAAIRKAYEENKDAK